MAYNFELFWLIVYGSSGIVEVEDGSDSDKDGGIVGND